MLLAPSWSPLVSYDQFALTTRLIFWFLRTRVIISNHPASRFRCHVCVLAIEPIRLFSVSLLLPFEPRAQNAQDQVLPPVQSLAWGLAATSIPVSLSSCTEILKRATPFVCSWGGTCLDVTSRMITFLLICFPPSCVSTSTYLKGVFFKMLFCYNSHA